MVGDGSVTCPQRGVAELVLRGAEETVVKMVMSVHRIYCDVMSEC